MYSLSRQERGAAVPRLFVIDRISPNTTLMRKNRVKVGIGGVSAGGNEHEKQTRHYGSPEHVHELMERLRWEQKLTVPILTGALDMIGESFCNSSLLDETRDFFRRRAILIPIGIETLPSCWLTTLPSLLLRTLKPHWSQVVPYMISELRMENGVLCFSFAQELPQIEKRFTRWDELRVTINRSLYPNLWRPLEPEHKHDLLLRFPELGTEHFPETDCSDGLGPEADL